MADDASTRKNSASQHPTTPQADGESVDIDVEDAERPEPERPPIAPGTRLGKYLLEEKIGEGGMAEVWRARLKSDDFDRQFAIKFMRDKLMADDKYADMFIHEARVAQNIPEHANVVSVIEFDRIRRDAEPALAGRYYLVMEWVKGADLAKFMWALAKERRPLSQKVALFIAGEVLKGLATIHGARDEHSQILGLVHRDISPHNVLLSYTGGVKISDFGVAKMDNVHTTKSLRGKFTYFAPEVVKGKVQNQRSDQFAVGIVLWEMLSGRRLFAGANDAEILHKVSQCQIPETGRQLDPALDKVLHRMLAADPNSRFPSADDALSAVYEIPTYSPDARQLAELLLFLFPDPEQRYPTPQSPRALAQVSGPISDYGFPIPMEPSISVGIDWQRKEIAPVWPGHAGQKLFPEMNPAAWARWWKRAGVDRTAEVEDLLKERTETMVDK